MKLYIYEYVDGLTENYHDGGGAVVITNNDPRDVLDDARRPDPENTPVGEPDHVIDAPTETTERVIIFPNAGCC